MSIRTHHLIKSYYMWASWQNYWHERYPLFNFIFLQKKKQKCVLIRSCLFTSSEKCVLSEEFFFAKNKINTSLPHQFNNWADSVMEWNYNFVFIFVCIFSLSFSIKLSLLRENFNSCKLVFKCSKIENKKHVFIIYKVRGFFVHIAILLSPFITTYFIFVFWKNSIVHRKVEMKVFFPSYKKFVSLVICYCSYFLQKNHWLYAFIMQIHFKSLLFFSSRWH